MSSAKMHPGHKTAVYWNVSTDLVLHWIHCNVYPQSIKTTKGKIEKAVEEFNALKRYPKAKRSTSYWKRLQSFILSCRKIFDIRADHEQTKRQEKLWDVKMTLDDEEFYHNQCSTPQVGYCTTFIDAKWKKSNLRKIKEAGQNENAQFKAQEYATASSSKPYFFEDDIEVNENDSEADLDTESTKYRYDDSIIDHKDDDMPFRFRHIRSGPRSVRPEYYILAEKLKAELHMSEKQVHGSIVAVANILFGRKDFEEWKLYNRDAPSDWNTLPAPTNLNRTEEYIEAMVLAGIVTEIMSPETDQCVVTYSNDGSSQSGVGSYVVQSFMINGKQRTLPTMSVFNETKENLKELEIMTLKILCAASGHKYTAKEILEHIDFVMTDSTAHNLGVIEQVCNELDSDSIPNSLICNVHPMLMFQRKIKEVFQEIHDAVGSNRINDCFLIDVDFRNESFIYKAIYCLTSLISSEFSAKPWNRQEHFDSFIKPKENESLPLKDHRFNRLFDCSTTLLYHLDDIKLYLETFTNVLNGIAIIDRSFLDMELLVPILATVAVISVHFTRPFLSLLLDTKTNYDELLKAFPIFYEDLTLTNHDDLLQTKVRVCKFVSSDRFSASKPKVCLLDRVDGCISRYNKEMKQLLAIFLSRMADGFSEQRGAMFGFGPRANEDTGAIMKISDINDSDLRNKLNQAPVHNLNEERSVGFIGYELQIRGKRNIESVSKKLVVNKGIDFLCQSKPTEFKKFVKPSKEIKELKLQWKNSVDQHKENAFSEKEKSNLKTDAVKYNLLEKLKNQDKPGPFVSPEEIKMFLNDEIGEKIKNDRLYDEVRYARITSMSLKPTASVFRLMRNHRRLETNEYADNLICYLDSARACQTLTLDDLSNVLHGITAKSDPESNAVVSDESFKVGEHVVAYWHGKKTAQWYLGVVERFNQDGVLISYMTRCEKNKLEWIFPERAEVLQTCCEQIIARNVKVEYLNTVVIKCRIASQELIEDLDTNVKNL